MVLFVTALSARETSALAGLLVGAALLGAGMGLLYPDLLGRCLAEPPAPDGISQDRMAAAIVLSESAGMGLSTTIAYTWFGTGLGLAGSSLARTQLLYLALLPVAAIMVVRLAAATRSGIRAQIILASGDVKVAMEEGGGQGEHESSSRG